LLPTKSEDSDKQFERLVKLLLEESAIGRGRRDASCDIRVAAERIVMQTARRFRRDGSRPEGRCAQPDAPSELADGRDHGNGYEALGIDVLPKLLARAEQLME